MDIKLELEEAIIQYDKGRTGLVARSLKLILDKIKKEPKDKTVITFGSAQLSEINWFINPNKVMLVIEEPEMEARETVRRTFIGNNFCTSYRYDQVAERFKNQFQMKEYSLEELIEIKGTLEDASIK